MKKVAAILVLLVFACSVRKQTDTVKQSNVVFILIDDLGWKDIAVNGSDYYQTPNIDNLATEGIRFTNAYSACTVCSPTRASIMTGKYPATINLTDWIEGHDAKDKPLSIPDWTMYMDTSEFTLAEAFQNAGYTTAHIGKWHLGEESKYWPENHGFDMNIGGWSMGRPNREKDKSNGYFAPFGNPRLEDKPTDDYLTDRLTDEAVAFLKTSSKSNKPFFLNFWTYNVHTPLQAKQDKIDKYEALKDINKLQNNATYAAMVEHMDDAIGRIIKTLKDEGLYDNTIIVFTSDNGGLIGKGKNKVTNNSPLRHGKGGMYEGGIRVPLILRVPNELSGNKISNQPVISMDYFPTLIALTNIKVPEEVKQNLEGKDLTKMLKSNNVVERDLFWHYPHYHSQGATPYSAIRSGDWKLVYFYETNTSELYDLKRDIGESLDVSNQFPEVKTELLQRLKKWKIKVEAQEPTPRIK